MKAPRAELQLWPGVTSAYSLVAYGYSCADSVPGGKIVPTSYYQAISQILEHIHAEAPMSILDIGVGFGKYGVLCRETLEVPHGRYYKDQWQVRIDGVEAYEGYRNPLHDYVYDRVYYRDIRELIGQLPSYDVVLLIDVIEHMSKDEGLFLIKQIMQHTKKALLVSTPLQPSAQEQYMSNQYEAHRSRWTPLDFRAFDFSYHVVPSEDGGAQVFKVYPQSKAARSFPTDAVWDHPPLGTEPLRVAFVLPHHNLTGGLKMLLEQIRWLRRRHHRVRVLYRGNAGDPVLPSWTDVQADEEVLVPRDQSYLPYLSGCHVAAAGWLDQLPELSKGQTPVLYWEQGNEGIFGQVHSATKEPLVRKHLYECYTQPVALAAVSPLVASLLQVRYGRKAAVIPNGVDTETFYPGQPPGNNTILLVGNPALPFKGFEVALQALNRAWKAGYRFHVNWVCQVRPHVTGAEFPLRYIVNPPQDELPEWYRNADLFVFPSWYEGFGMPPLEAMASGVPVVATSCGGISSYAVPGVNVLLVEPGDVDSMATAIAYLLDDPEARFALAAAGRETALRFRWSETIEHVEAALRRVSAMRAGP